MVKKPFIISTGHSRYEINTIIMSLYRHRRAARDGRCVFIGLLRLLLCILLLLPLFTGCAKKAEKPKMNMPAPVTVGSVLEKTVPVELRAIGNVEAYATVSIKTQVTGELLKVSFNEGQDVKKGDLLFKIDPRPFDASLKQVEAVLARDIAHAEEARAQSARYTKLIQEGVVSKEQHDQIKTNEDALEAVVRAGRAAVENAKVQLSYCTIYSPIDGRTGDLSVDEGNIVKANDATLVVINQITPIHVSFSLPEHHLADIKQYRAQGTLKITATVPGQEQIEGGVMTFLDNAVDRATGTVRLKGTFENKDRLLWPGQFVNVVLNLTSQPNAIVAPSQAIQTGQEGQYVFVVQPNHTAELRPVTVSRTFNGESVVEKGLRPGETVVTDGQLRLTPGSKVEVKGRPATKQGEAS